MRRRDLLGILEAAYALDRDDTAWLDGLAESVQKNVPFRTVGVVVNGYDVSDPARPRLDRNGVRACGDTDTLGACYKSMQKFYENDPNRIRATYCSLDEGLGLEAPADRELLAEHLHALRIGDVYGINGRNPSGQGLLVGIYLPMGFPAIPLGTRKTFARIARHLAAAYRLRKRLAGGRGRAILSKADAVISRDGKIEHATGVARQREAREELQHAATTLARARGRARFDKPDEAVAKWRTLVDARWSLVDHFERDGSYYLVAQRNDCQPAPMAFLTQRERQVVALATMGYSNKAIGYELGLATSTVGVLLSRAMRRLGLRSRRELVLTRS